MVDALGFFSCKQARDCASIYLDYELGPSPKEQHDFRF